MENISPPESKLSAALVTLEQGNIPDMRLLENIDPKDYPFLEPELVFFWRDWLLAEVGWWKAENASAFRSLEERIGRSLIPSASQEWHRIKCLAAFLGSRIAIESQDFVQARHWLNESAKESEENWESDYLRGLISWAEGKLDNARLYLEKSAGQDLASSRVGFELVVLKSMQSGEMEFSGPGKIPLVHDALATSAILFFKKGYVDQAVELLKLLDEQEEPHSLRLLWPSTYKSRIQQGLSLRAHLAEAGQDWPAARKFWSMARQTNFPSSSSKYLDRAHQLYLLGLCLENKNRIPMTPEQKNLYNEFHQELSLLALHALTGDAMFYRGLAAHETRSDRTVQDGRALLRQRRWVEKIRQESPCHLLIIGDWLLQAGLIDEATRAYQLVLDLPDTQIRMFYGALMQEEALPQERLLNLLEDVNLDAVNRGPILFIKVVSCLASPTPDLAAAQNYLEQAIQSGLSQPMEQVGQVLLAVAGKQTRKTIDLNLLTNRSDIFQKLAALHAGLNVVAHPMSIAALVQFQEVFGEYWRDYFPGTPLNAIGYELRKLYNAQDFVSALEIIQLAERLGVIVPIEWHNAISNARTIQLAMQGDLEAAEQACTLTLARTRNRSTPGKNYDKNT